MIKLVFIGHRIRFDLEKVKDPRIAEVFKAKVGGKFAAHCVLESNVDTIAKQKCYSQQLKKSLGDRGRRFNLGSQTRFWIYAIRDGN